MFYLNVFKLILGEKKKKTYTEVKQAIRSCNSRGLVSLKCIHQKQSLGEHSGKSNVTPNKPWKVTYGVFSLLHYSKLNQVAHSHSTLLVWKAALDAHQSPWELRPPPVCQKGSLESKKNKKKVLCAASAASWSPQDSGQTANTFSKWNAQHFHLEISAVHVSCKVTNDGIAQQLGPEGKSEAF